MRRGASLSTSHFWYAMSNFCMCFLQQYQHPPCLKQAVFLDSICSLDNASNEYVALLFYNISLACPHLREATVCAVSNVDGIRQQAWETEMEPQTVWHLWFGGMSNGWIATLGISRGRRNMGSAQNWWLERWEYLVGLYTFRNMWRGIWIFLIAAPS